jgi:tetratricopeptide (TPR) repeat protein
MDRLMFKAGIIFSIGLCLALAAHAQMDMPAPMPAQPRMRPDPPPLLDPTEATPAPAAMVTKQERQAYAKLEAEDHRDPAKLSQDIEAFVAKYPDSAYAAPLYSELAQSYFRAGEMDQMQAAASKVLKLDPNSPDVLPILAVFTARTAKAPDLAAQLDKAEDYGKRGLGAIGSLPKPDSLDDAAFAKEKNARAALCHSALGLVYIDRGKSDDARKELLQAVALSAEADPVDLYLLGKADVATSHFTDAINVYAKCSAAGPLQAQCKTGLDDARQKRETGIEAPE